MVFGRKQKAGRAEVDRLIEKGRYKDAVKQAKLCYRDEGTPEHHRLLERAYLLRAEQLRQGGMPTAAREVAHHLVEFGITDPELVGPAAEMLVAVGMADRALALQGRQADPEAGDRLIRRAADEAVLHPERASGAPAEVREGAGQVRAALKALEAGDEEGARSALKDVARNSPFAEWKLFVRGLAAFRRRDDEEWRASWERLDPARSPSRIAKALRDLEGADAKPAGGPDLEAVERKAFGEPVLGPLRRLGALVAEDRWAEAVRVLGPLRRALKRIDPALAERLTRVLYSPLIKSVSRLGYDEARRLVRDFAGAAEPLAIDPRWNRLWAMLWEGPQGHVDEAEPYWRKYLKDLDATTALRDEERPAARALVLTHLGRELVEEASALSGPGLFGPSRADAEVRRLRKRAVDCMEEGLRACPTHPSAYRELIAAYREWEQPEEAALVGRRLLEVAPDDFVTLMDLADHHYRSDDPARSLEYAERARAVRPLDREAIGREWAARVALARHHALGRRYDEARAELERAERLDPEMARPPHFVARKAVLELKAGGNARAEELIAEAERSLPEPAPLWLALIIEARRYKLPKKKREPFEERWAEDLPKKARSETAGALAELLGAFLIEDVNYTGRATHLKQVVGYLRRTTRIKYRREDLGRVCSFLELVADQRKLFETLAKRGDRLFPEAPEFPMLLGAFEMQKGPFRGDLTRARRHFEKALKLAEAQAPTDPKAAALLPKVRETLTTLEDLTAGPLGLPFGSLPFGGPGSPLPDPSSLPAELLDMIEAMGGLEGLDPDDLFDEFDDEDDFDEYWDEGPPASSPPLPRPRRPDPKKKKKKR